MPRITKRFIDTLGADGRDRIVWDSDLKGFGVRVRRSGAMSFVFQYRPAGQGRGANPRKLTIGSVGTITPDQARKIASEHAYAVRAGRDPALERRNLRDAPTVRDLAEHYRKHHLPTKRPSSRAEDNRMLDLFIEPRVGDRRVADDGLHDAIKALHRSMADRPYRANRVLSLLSKMFSLATSPSLRWRSDNPCKGIVRYPEDPRERFLTHDELARLVAAIDAYPDRAIGNALIFILLTGCRRGEALNATWGQFDLTRGEWIKPSSHTKQKKTHRLPLSRPAMDLLETIGPAHPQEHLFPSPRRPGRPITDLKSAWRSICADAKVAGLRIHDLRHSYASFLASEGYTLPVIGRLLGHASAKTTTRYLHLFDDDLRKATESVGRVISRSGDA